MIIDKSLEIDLSDDEQVKSFVRKFPTDQQPLDCRALDFVRTSRIFWTKTTATRPPQRKTTYVVDDAYADVWRRWRVHEKIKTMFSIFFSPQMSGLMQFWAPAPSSSSTTRLQLLSTSCQPFALDNLDNLRLFNYRIFSINHSLQYIDGDDPLTTAFRTHFSEVVLDLRKISGNRTSPLVDKAIDCGLTCLILLPVFYHPSRHHQTSKYSSSCVGVVECCINAPSDLQPLFRFLNLALKVSSSFSST